MPCGHGGICEDCSIDIWKTHGNCPFCRDKISQCLEYEIQTNKEKQNKVLKVIGAWERTDESCSVESIDNASYEM